MNDAGKNAGKNADKNVAEENKALATSVGEHCWVIFFSFFSLVIWKKKETGMLSIMQQ